MKNIIIDAIENEKLFLQFQPIVCAISHEVCFYEGLIRIKSEEENGSCRVIYPDEFLSESKKHKLYKNITMQILNISFEILQKHKELRFFINLTMEDFCCKEITNFILQTIEKNNDLCSRVVFEITESEAYTPHKTLLKTLKKLRQHNIKIAIDDFGSGYSNISSLLKINSNFIKLDGEIIRNVHKSKNREIIKLIVKYANKFNIEIVGEHVETEAQALTLKELGVHLLQGYYFSKPINLEELQLCQNF